LVVVGGGQQSALAPDDNRQAIQVVQLIAADHAGNLVGFNQSNSISTNQFFATLAFPLTSSADDKTR
jgi:hypothetical protein